MSYEDLLWFCRGAAVGCVVGVVCATVLLRAAFRGWLEDRRR